MPYEPHPYWVGLGMYLLWAQIDSLVVGAVSVHPYLACHYQSLAWHPPGSRAFSLVELPVESWRMCSPSVQAQIVYSEGPRSQCHGMDKGQFEVN